MIVASVGTWGQRARATKAAVAEERGVHEMGASLQDGRIECWRGESESRGLRGQRGEGFGYFKAFPTPPKLSSCFGFFLSHGEDPPINIVHSCVHCHGRMGVVRVHEGSTNPPARGKIAQTCNICHKSLYHTEAYIDSDEEHLLVRYHARQVGRPIPAESLNAPLRFVPPPEHEPPPAGPVQCHAVGCTIRTGGPRQGAQKCIEYKCKNCCTQSGADAAEQQAYRDSCNVHSVPGVPGQPAAALVFNLHRSLLVSHPLSPISLFMPLLRTLHCSSLNLDEVVEFQLHGVVVEFLLPVTVAVRPDPKAERQRLEKLLQQTCTFYFYHTLSWTTLQAIAVFQIDKSRPTIIRIRPNLLTEIELKDCPGTEELLVLQPRLNKRRLDDMVSPPKKVARTNVANTAHTRTVIEIPDSLHFHRQSSSRSALLHFV
ncbi:hypothetical protein B0H13DRAFT_2281138 [Mycena leptocephala]|nr:hypothetical protein B0H13DRAFT_2281138 [Mycena leptocephala]